MGPSRRTRITVVLLAMAFLNGADLSNSHGYNLFGPCPWGDDLTYHLKWGDIFTPGSPGGTITWSLMPDGVSIDPSFNDPNISGVSSLNSIMNGIGQSETFAAIERVFDRWSSVANIYFVQVPDSGAPFASAAAIAPNTGQIRLGAFAINAGIGAVGYAPPPNGGSLEGDVLLNANSTFFLDNGAEGELIDIFNDFESLLVHEVGHAIGLAHSDVCSVMSVDFDCYKYVNRRPDSDDLAGVQFLYGPALAADFDRDNDVDAGDLIAWKGGFGIDAAAERAEGDADGDGDVDGSDFLTVQRELGSGTALPTISVPEPSLLACLAASAGSITCICWRRRLARGHRFASLKNAR